MKPTSNYTNSGKLQALRESNTREQLAINTTYPGAPNDSSIGSGGAGGGGGGVTPSVGPSPTGSFSSSSSAWSGVHSSIMAPPEAVHLFQLQSFLLATLAHLPFDYTEEPLQAVYWVGRNVPLTANVLLGDMRTLLLKVR